MYVVKFTVNFTWPWPLMLQAPHPFLLPPPVQVRSAAVFALGTYILHSSDGVQQSEHAKTIERTVAMMILPVISDGSPLVRQVSYLAGFFFCNFG